MAIIEKTGGGTIPDIGSWTSVGVLNTNTGVVSFTVNIPGIGIVVDPGTPYEMAVERLTALINNPAQTRNRKRLLAGALNTIRRQNAELLAENNQATQPNRTTEPLPPAASSPPTTTNPGQTASSANKSPDDRTQNGALSGPGLASGVAPQTASGVRPTLAAAGAATSVSAVEADQAASAAFGTSDSGIGAPSDDLLAPDPGRINPLSKLSTYTYSLVLYMVTPEKMNEFLALGGTLSGIKTPGSGVYIVSQSGGVNNGTDERLITLSKTLGLGQEGYDYYIDDLSMTTFLPGGPNRSTVSTELKFKIYEPYSFNLLTDIARASQQLNATSRIANNPDVELSGFQQHYILGIKFYGYDLNGNLVTRDSPQFTGYDNGDSGDQNAVIQRFFAIKFTNIKFKLDGKMTVYNCEAVVVSEQEAYNQTNGGVKSQLNLTGGTVGEVLSGGGVSSTSLAATLTNANEQLQRGGQIDIASKISIEFLDDNNQPVSPAESEIGRSPLLDDAAFAQATAPLSGAKSTNKVTVADTFRATTIDTTKRTIGVVSGTPITTVIDNIIVKSRWITDALTKTVTDTPEGRTVNVTSRRELRWYTINPIVKAVGLDSKTKNWTYDVTYQIKPYNIPYVRTSLADKSKYPGPYKFYNYLFTGRNTEIISYEQQFDNLYYTIASASTNPSQRTETPGRAPVAVQNTPGSSDPRGGKNNSGSRLNDEVRAQLYSPGDQAEAKIRIIGDPDYIMTTVGVTLNSASQFYGNDSSISPLGGQIFIQVVFNMAVDYNTVNGQQTPTGLMEVTDKIQFYQTDRVRKSGIKGMVYMVYQVDSQFVRGQFTQTLMCLMVDETQLVTPESESQDAGDRPIDRPQQPQSAASVPPAQSNATAQSAAAPTPAASAPANTRGPQTPPPTTAGQPPRGHVFRGSQSGRTATPQSAPSNTPNNRGVGNDDSVQYPPI